MHINKKVKFLLHKRKSGDTDNLSIRMRITIRGENPIDFPTGHRINEANWDSLNFRALPSAGNASEVNRTIDEWISVCNEIFARYELLEKRIPQPGEVRDLFNDMVGRKTDLKEKLNDPAENLFAVFDMFTSSMGKQNQWTDATYIKFRAIRMHLHEFDPLLNFYSLNESKMQDYLAYLNKTGMRNTTIAKHLAFVRWFLRWAATQGFYLGNLHESFKPKLRGIGDSTKEIIYLSRNEVRQLETFEFIPMYAHLERVRDVFLFCCFTGLRYSDVAKLKRTDIKDGFISVVTKKTCDGLRIELNKHSQMILDKYKDEQFKDNLALPVVSNVKMNAHLKTLGQLVGLDEPTRIVFFQGNVRHEEVLPKWALLTTHVARRTFVVTALQLGIPSEVIMKWTGHSDFAAMKPYVAIVDELKSKAMSLFDDF